MASPKTGQIIVSDNDATGISLNWSPRITCVAQCPYCYATKRTVEDAQRICKKMGLEPGTITANTGPITWPVQQEAYKRNTRVLLSLSMEGIHLEAQRIARSLRRRGYDNIRANGCGDSTPKAVRLYSLLGAEGIKVWGFSRRTDMIELQTSEAARFSSRQFRRPFMLCSVDRFTTDVEVAVRITVAEKLDRAHKVLAYMALPDEDGRDIKSRWYWPRVRVVLGYHAASVHTVLNMARECPKTAQKGITCQVCKRCQGGK